jgi:hypothetical protein
MLSVGCTLRISPCWYRLHSEHADEENKPKLIVIQFKKYHYNKLRLV